MRSPRPIALAEEAPELATAQSALTGERVNRFLQVTESVDDVVMQNRMQRRLGQRTGTCFQRCVGMDAINSMYSVTYDIDQAHGTRVPRALRRVREAHAARELRDRRRHDRPEGRPQQGAARAGRPRSVRARGGAPARRRRDPRREDAPDRLHQLALAARDADDAPRPSRTTTTPSARGIPVDHPGITYIYGRQSCDTRALEGGEIDAGNAQFGGQEAMIVFEDVFVPYSHVFMNGEYDFAAPLVERFTAYHRRSYVCKTGLGDVLIGAAATIADYNGADKASARARQAGGDGAPERDHLRRGHRRLARVEADGGGQLPERRHARQRVQAQRHALPLRDRAPGAGPGGRPDGHAAVRSGLREPGHRTDPRKYLKARPGVSVDNRRRVLRLIENMTLGRNAVGYLTESMHGAGSPQAQRIQIARLADLPAKKKLAEALAGVDQAENVKKK